MKFALLLLLACVAMAAAAPQLLTTWPGYTGVVPAASTVVAGPTVYNTPWGYGGRYIAPGYIGTYY